jgi:hypothetical protein
MRRKILVGAIVLAKVEQGVIQKSVLRSWLEGRAPASTIVLSLA